MKTKKEMSSVEMQYRHVIKAGGTPEIAKDVALNTLSGNVAMENDQLLGGRLDKMVKAALEQAWNLAIATNEPAYPPSRTPPRLPTNAFVNSTTRVPI